MIPARLVFMTLLVLAIVGLYWTVDQAFISPAVAGQSQLVRLQSDLDDLTRRLQVARTELERLERNPPEHTNAVLAGMDSAAALAWLQAAVRDTVTASQGVALAYQATTSPISQSYAKVSVLVRARFSEAGLLGFVRGLEEADPPLVFELLEIQPLGNAGDSKSLDITATITAFQANAAAS